MLKFREDDWTYIQHRMVADGLTQIPNGRFVDSVLDSNNSLSYLIEFDTSENEMMLILRWQ